MANASAVDVKNIRGQDPQLIIEKIIRTRIYESRYWKEDCFGLSIETLIERAVKLDHVGGMYGNQKPTPFICLTLKMLALQPSDDIIDQFLANDDFKYLKALAALYVRLTGKPLTIYQKLEPLLVDFRKLRERNKDGSFGLTYLDVFVDNLLREERFLDIKLPHLLKRHILEERGDLDARVPLVSEQVVQEFNLNASMSLAEADLNDQEESNPHKLSFKKIKLQEKPEESSKSSYDAQSRSAKNSLSIEETNAIRAKLGLKPLSK